MPFFSILILYFNQFLTCMIPLSCWNTSSTCVIHCWQKKWILYWNWVCIIFNNINAWLWCITGYRTKILTKMTLSYRQWSFLSGSPFDCVVYICFHIFLPSQLLYVEIMKINVLKKEKAETQNWEERNNIKWKAHSSRWHVSKAFL